MKILYASHHCTFIEKNKYRKSYIKINFMELVMRNEKKMLFKIVVYIALHSLSTK